MNDALVRIDAKKDLGLRAHLPVPAELHEPAEFERWWQENGKKLVPDHAGVFKLAP
jgi:hypothetical protein